MSEVYFYRGLYKVKVVTESEGFRIVEAQEDFEDHLNGEKVSVKAGEQRIVPSGELYKKKTLSPPVPEHVYERRLEKKLKSLIETEKSTL